jgi:putative ABC transport system substrate-binding protein
MKNGSICVFLVFCILLLLVVPCAQAEGEAYTVGILQYVEHPALDASSEFFLKALADNGLVEGENLTVSFHNASADPAATQLMSQQLAQEGCMLLLGVATPAVQALAAQTETIPILGVAVTDYVAAGLIASNEAPGINVSGTTDMNPIDLQIELLAKLVPDAKTIGIVYTSNEVNSKIQADIAKAEAEKRGLAVEIKTISAVGEVQQAVETISSMVDALYIPTDNVFASAMPVVAEVAEAKKLPVITGEANQCESGGLATMGLDYKKLGYQTGLMAVRILKDGANPAEMPIERSTDADLSLNLVTAELIGFTFPQDLLDAAVNKFVN